MNLTDATANINALLATMGVIGTLMSTCLHLGDLAGRGDQRKQ